MLNIRASHDCHGHVGEDFVFKNLSDYDNYYTDKKGLAIKIPNEEEMFMKIL